MNIFKIFILVFILFFISACTSKHLKIKSLQPSIMTDKKINNIVLEEFKKDTINQTDYLEEKLVNHIVNKQKVFKLQNSYTNIDAIITGEVIESSLFYDFYYDEDEDFAICKKYEYKNGKRTNRCLRYKIVRIPCERKNYRVKTKVNVLNKNERIIFSKIYSKSKTTDQCYKNRIYYPHPYYFNRLNITREKYSTNSNLAKQIAKEIIKDISPHYIYQDIKIIDKLEKEKYKETIKNKFDFIIELLENKNIYTAQEKLHELNKKLNFNSYEVLYNLALTYEALDSIQRAKEYYEEAKIICTNTDDLKLIANAIARAQLNLENKIKAKSQLPNL